MKTTSRILASAVLCALAGGVSGAQTATSTDAPINWISATEFNQMLQEGLLTPATQAVVNRQNQQAQATYLQNQAIVAAYLNQNPNLTNLARLVNTVPSGTPNSEGSYEISVPLRTGGTQTVETLGEMDKMAALARAITSSELLSVQLQLYTELYNRLPAELLRKWPNGQPPIAPSQLQGASLATVENAMQSFVSQWSTIVNNLPPLPSPTAVGCSAELGAGGAPNTDWGDQTRSAGCTTPSPKGIYANFDFPSKGLLSCIKEQGARGTCHIFAATSAVEELIARDTGVFVNLSEQDFQEHVKLLWAPSLYSAGGDSGVDLNQATKNSYKFAYENQYAYNPSYGKGTDDVDSCKNYPSSEPGCSDTASQAPEFCAVEDSDGITVTVCGYALATLSGRSPYAPNGANNVWNHKDTDLSVDYMILALALNEGVDLAFTETPNFGAAPGGYVAYDTADLLVPKGGHVVHVVGYVGNADLAKKLPSAPAAAGGGYFIIKNSWGACAGDAGYWYMPVDYVKAQARDVDIVSSVVE